MPRSPTSKATPVEVKAAVERLGRAFEEFKSTNNSAEAARLTRSAVDALLEQKLSRINENLSRLQSGVDTLHMNMNRPHFGGESVISSAEALEHKAAFYNNYMRKGLETGLIDLESKALSIGTDAEGGYAVPEELDQTIDALLRDVSPIRRYANVVQIGNANYRKLVNIGGTGSGWASETGARAETTTPTFSEIV
ncbi:MAG: phage major capsid protein, partial [Proteobacteria bacterium]|nr:phage major capsid protein [Pseudomonadota bacterium]